MILNEFYGFSGADNNFHKNRARKNSDFLGRFGQARELGLSIRSALAPGIIPKLPFPYCKEQLYPLGKG